MCVGFDLFACYELLKGCWRASVRAQTRAERCLRLSRKGCNTKILWNSRYSTINPASSKPKISPKTGNYPYFMSSRTEKDSAIPSPAPSQQPGSEMPKHHLHAPPRNFAEELENNYHDTPHPSQRVDIYNYYLSLINCCVTKIHVSSSLSDAVCIRRRRNLFVLLKTPFLFHW